MYPLGSLVTLYNWYLELGAFKKIGGVRRGFSFSPQGQSHSSGSRNSVGSVNKHEIYAIFVLPRTQRYWAGTIEIYVRCAPHTHIPISMAGTVLHSCRISFAQQAILFEAKFQFHNTIQTWGCSQHRVIHQLGTTGGRVADDPSHDRWASSGALRELPWNCGKAQSPGLILQREIIT